MNFYTAEGLGGRGCHPGIRNDQVTKPTVLCPHLSLRIRILQTVTRNLHLGQFVLRSLKNDK